MSSRMLYSSVECRVKYLLEDSSKVATFTLPRKSNILSSFDLINSSFWCNLIIRLIFHIDIETFVPKIIPNVRII